MYYRDRIRTPLRTSNVENVSSSSQKHILEVSNVWFSRTTARAPSQLRTQKAKDSMWSVPFCNPDAQKEQSIELL